MYSEKAIEKYLVLSTETYKKVIADGIENHHVRISTGNRKIGRSLNISLLPIHTCSNCSECKNLCYDIKACLQYQNVTLARAINTAIARLDMARYFAEIDNRMYRRRKNKYFRFHVAGDIISREYLEYMVHLAIKHPDFTIWTYTKNYHVVNMYVAANGNNRLTAIPSNLHIMFSEWRGMQMFNPYGFPEFRVVFKDDENKPDSKTNFYCPGNCDICKELNRGCIAGENVYCNEH